MPAARPVRLTLGVATLLGAASLALHLLLATAVGPMLRGAGAQAPDPPASAAAPVIVRRIDVAPEPPLQEPQALLPVQVPQPPPARPAESAARPPARTAAVPPAYYETADVDVPAMPDPDWNLDAAGLATVGVKRLSFEVLVSRDGVAEQCTVLSMEPPMPSTWPFIASQLCRTRLSPALRRGEPVPNVRRIELVTGG